MAKTVFILTAVLCAFELDGERYQPGQLVEFSAPVADALGEQGQIDKHKDAVSHLKSQGIKVVRHPVKAVSQEWVEPPAASPEAGPESLSPAEAEAE